MGRGTEQTFLRRRRADGPRLLDEVLVVTNASETRASTAGRPCLAPVGPAAGGGTEEQAGGRPRVITPTCRVHTVTSHASADADGSDFKTSLAHSTQGSASCRTAAVHPSSTAGPPSAAPAGRIAVGTHCALALTQGSCLGPSGRLLEDNVLGYFITADFTMPTLCSSQD